MVDWSADTNLELNTLKTKEMCTLPRNHWKHLHCFNCCMVL